MNDIHQGTPQRQEIHPLDAMAKASDNHRILLENDKVRVLDTWVAPGERTAVHAHQWPATLYVVSWSDFVRYDPDGNILLDSRNMTTKPPIGATLWAEPIGPHYVHNVGDTELRILAIEVK